MSVLGRILRLTKAELENVLSRSKDGSSSRESAGDAAETGSAGWSRGPRASSSEDPKLARYYANLELPYGADLDAVHSAWRNLTRKYHPDLHSQDEEKRQVATELVKGLNEAYEGLKSALAS